MAIKLKNEENETKTLYDLEYGKIKKMNKNVKHVENETKKKQFALEYGYSKTQRIRNTQCRTWIMVRKQKIMKNEKQTMQNLKQGETH